MTAKTNGNGGASRYASKGPDPMVFATSTEFVGVSHYDIDHTVAGEIVEAVATPAVLIASVTAQLAVLPEPLRLKHGPLLVTVETWSDGTVVARLPGARLFASSHDDATALEELAEEIASFVSDVVVKFKGAVAGPMARQFAVVSALVDTSGLSR